jgi:predicted Zn-dependent protease
MPIPASRPRWRLPALLIVLLATLLAGGWRIARELRAGWHWRAAQTALEQEDFAAARGHLDECLRAWPGSAETHFLAARAARRAGAPGEARRLLREAARRGWVPEALDLERALLEVQSGELTSVEKYLAVCLENDHPDAALIVEVLAPAYLAQYRLGPAQSCAARWAELQPDSARAWWYLGTIRERRRRKNEAADAYRAAVAADPNHVAARLALCRLLLEINRTAELGEHVEELLRQRGDDPEVSVLAARYHDRMGRREAARRLLAGVLAAHPGHAPALVHLGRLELEAGQPKKAEPFLRQARSLTPFDPELLILLVRCLKQVGTPEEVRQVEERRQGVERDLAELKGLVREISRHPGDPDRRRRAGEIYLRNGQPEEGLRWLGSALRLQPDHRATHLALAKHFEQAGQQDRAEAHRALSRGEKPAPGVPIWLTGAGMSEKTAPEPR